MRSIFAIALMIGSTAHAKDLTPVRLEDGRYLLIAPFPATADRICFRFLRAEPSPDVCVDRPPAELPPIAAAAVGLEQGDIVHAVAINEDGESPLSASRWVVPAVEEAK